MKLRARWSACMAIAALWVLPAAIAHARSAQNPPSSSADMQSQMQQALAAAQPGPQHAQLMKVAGDYTTRETFYASGSEPQESTGTAKLKPILGGRFLEEENSGQSFGQPYSGLRLYGYNNGSKQYEAIWIYDGSTAFLVLDGTSDDNGKTVRYSGAFLGPDGERQTLRVTITHDDADHFTVKLLGESAGGMSTLETVYTRVRKSAPAPQSRK